MLFGSNEKYEEYALRVRRGETGFLYNYQTKKLYGVFEAESDGGFNLVSDAWGGRFPYQVQVKWKKKYLATLDYDRLRDEGLGNVAYTMRIPDDVVQALEKLFESTTIPPTLEPIDSWLGTRFLELRDRGLDWRQFEERIADLFEAIGFDVERLGHTVEGPYPDIVLYSPPDLSRYQLDFWVVVDCKSTPGYMISEKDRRAMEDYVEGHRAEVMQRGFDPNNAYFLFVAPSFDDVLRSIEQLRAIQERTGAVGALLDVEAALELLRLRLKLGRRFNIVKFPGLLRMQELNRGLVNRILGQGPP